MKSLKQNILPLTLFMILSVLIVWAGFRFEPALTLSSDGFFHYYRFEYLYQNVKELNFFNDFYTEGYLYDMGYPTGIFYPQMLFYPFITLSLLLKLSPIQGFLLTLILVFFCIFTSAYFAVKTFNKERSDGNLMLIGLFGALIYVFLPLLIPLDFTRPFNSYLTFNISARQSIAEVIAFIFFPWVIVGMKNILKDKPEGTVLLIALLGVLYSHILSGVFVGIAVIITCIFKAKDILSNKERLRELLKVLGLFLLLGAYQIFPMLEMILFQDYAYNVPYFDSGRLLEHAVPFGTQTLPKPFILVQICIGALLMVSFIRYKKLEVRFIILGVMGFYVSSIFFPWQYLEGSAVSFIQFPSRMVTTFSLFLSFSIPVILKIDKSRVSRYISAVILTVIITLNINSSYNIQMYKGRHISNVDLEERYGTVVTIGHGAEYLPAGIDVDDGEYVPELGFNILYVSDKMNEILEVAHRDRYLLPKFYHKGYKVIKDGEEISYHSGYNGLIETEFPVDEDEVEVVRERTVTQNISFMLSVGTFMAWVYVWRKRRGKEPE